MKTLRIRSLVLAPFLLAGCPDSGGGDDGASTDPPQDDDDDNDDDGGLDGLLDGIGDPADPCAPRSFFQISTNHGHTLQEGNALQDRGLFELGGNAGHDHGIPVSEQQLDTLFNGGLVSVETTTNSLHTHQIVAGVTFPCGGFDDGFDDDFDDGQIPPGIEDDDG